MAEPLWTIADVAKHFRVSIKTVRRWHMLGMIPPPIRVHDGGVFRWKPEVIRDFVDECTQAEQCTN